MINRLKWLGLPAGLGLGIVIGIAFLLFSTPIKCAEASGTCPVGSTAVFTNNWAFQGGTAFTVTISGTPTVGNATLTIPDTAGVADTFVLRTATQTLTNKTLTSPIINTPVMSGGTWAASVGLGLRDTSAAFDVTIAATSNPVLSAGRTLTIDMSNVAHTIDLGSTANTITFPSVASDTVVFEAATQELDAKTLDSSVGKGTWTASGTWTLPSFTVNGTLTGGTATLAGTFAGTPTFSGAAIFSGGPNFTTSAPYIVNSIGAPPAVADKVGLGANDLAAGDARLAIQSEAGSVIYLGNDVLQYSAGSFLINENGSDLARFGLSGTSFELLTDARVAFGTGGLVTNTFFAIANGNVTDMHTGMAIQSGLVPAANTSSYAFNIAPTFIRPGSGTTPLMAVARFSIPALGGGATTIDEGSTVYIEGAFGVGTLNLAFHVDAGISKFDGAVRMEDSLVVGASGAAGGNGIHVQATSTNNAISTASQGAGSTTLYVGNASINVTSDARVKENIKPWNGDALALLRKLPVKEYDQYRNAPFGNVSHYVNLTAQDVYRIAPWAVNIQGNLDGTNPLLDGQNPWQVNYGLLTGLQIKAIQELDSKVQGLQQEIAELRRNQQN